MSKRTSRTDRIETATRIRSLLAAGVVAAVGAMCVALLGAGAGTATAATHNWDEVAECESNGDWSTDTGNGFYGGLQFTPETWRSHGGEGLASEASKAEQILVAENVLKTQGVGAWPVCGKYLTVADSGGREPVESEPQTPKTPETDTTTAESAPAVPETPPAETDVVDEATDLIARAALAGARELATRHAEEALAQG